MGSTAERLCSLVPLETTSAHLIREDEAAALLNFAALFHEHVYITDTVLGDHALLIESFRQGLSSSLFGRVKDMIDANILRALYRDKVVVRNRVLKHNEPTLRDIYNGWQERDRSEWNDQSGITSAV